MRRIPRARCFFMVSVCALGCGSRTALDDPDGTSGSRAANCSQTGLTVLASAQDGPTSIVIDSTYVYWNTQDGNIMRVSKCGGRRTTLASVPAGPEAIAIDQSSVYSAAPGELMKMPLAGGAATTLAKAPIYSYLLAFNGTSLLWLSDANIMKTPIDGSSTTPLVPVAAYSIGAIVVDSTSVYWSDLVQGAVMRMPLGGGTPTTLVSGLATVTALAVDDTNVYWTVGLSFGTGTGTGSVMKVARDGGTPTTLATGQEIGSRDYSGIAVDANNVYWTNQGSTPSAVMKVPLNGGTPTTVATSDKWDQIATRVTVDETSVYWLTERMVVKLTPK